MERSLKGNTIFSVASRYIRQLYYQKNYPDASRITEFLHGVPAELSDRTKTPPVATMGGSIFIAFMIIITAFIIGLGVVMDKEYGTDKALRVSPLSKTDYFIGKSIFPLFVMALYTIIALLMLGLMHVNILQVYLVVLSSFTISLLFGLLIGALGKNEIEAIGIGKLLSMVLMLAILGGTLLPENLQWLVWWAPIYWIYDILEEIFTETATWGSITWKSAVMVGLTGLYCPQWLKLIPSYHTLFGLDAVMFPDNNRHIIWQGVSILAVIDVVLFALSGLIFNKLIRKEA